MQNISRWRSNQFQSTFNLEFGQTKLMQIKRTLTAQYECCYLSQFSWFRYQSWISPINYHKWHFSTVICSKNLLIYKNAKSHNKTGSRDQNFWKTTSWNYGIHKQIIELSFCSKMALQQTISTVNWKNTVLSQENHRKRYVLRKNLSIVLLVSR